MKSRLSGFWRRMGNTRLRRHLLPLPLSLPDTDEAWTLSVGDTTRYTYLLDPLVLPLIPARTIFPLHLNLPPPTTSTVIPTLDLVDRPPERRSSLGKTLLSPWKSSAPRWLWCRVVLLRVPTTIVKVLATSTGPTGRIPLGLAYRHLPRWRTRPWWTDWGWG